MLVSIIIPVYNVQDYLVECLESVVAQTYTGAIECLIIDDCGQDNSINLVEEFVVSCKSAITFRIIQHECNKGLSGARNTGIRESHGDYLYFLDSDDRIDPNCIELMMELVDKFPHVDMVTAGAKTNGCNLEFLDYELRGTELPDFCNKKEALQKALLDRRIAMTAWNKLVRRDFIVSNNLFFVDGAINEDELWNFDMSKYLGSMAVLKQNTYNYNLRENSIITSLSELNRERNWIFLTQHMTECISKEYRIIESAAIFLHIVKLNNKWEDKGLISGLDKVILLLVRKATATQKAGLLLYYWAPRKVRLNDFFKRIIFRLTRCHELLTFCFGYKSC